MTEPVNNLTASDNKTDIGEATSENQVAANVISTHSPTGFLDLPTEVRLMIYRHLLLCPDNSYIRSWLLARSQCPVSILRTCRLIHREAFDVLYRENRFDGGVISQHGSLIYIPRIMDTIQHVRHLIELRIESVDIRTKDFLRFMHCFGNPSVSRGTLTIDFDLFSYGKSPLEIFRIPLRRFIQALGRFTNFRTVELHIYPVSEALDLFKAALEPVLGYAEYNSREKNYLRFHPLDHQNRKRELSGGDWSDSLDGIRLEWDQVVPIADDSKTPGLN